MAEDPQNEPDVVRVELIRFHGSLWKHLGRPEQTVLVGHHGPEWVGFPIRAWTWWGEADCWSEINHVSSLHEIASQVRREAQEREQGNG